jgi:endoglucanase
LDDSAMTPIQCGFYSGSNMRMFTITNVIIAADRIMVALLVLMAPARAVADGEPVRLAAEARFDLSADSRAGSIERGEVIAGNGTIVRKSWVDESEQPRGYTISFPITHLSWRALAVRFTPQRDGIVTLSLMGPFREAPGGLLFRQEVLWDDLRAEGALLRDGGFELRPGDVATAWQSDGGTFVEQSADAPAAEGTQYGRTWHNQTLFARLEVTGGRPVTIRLKARAVRPADLVEMKRLSGRSTPAHRSAGRFLRGANLGNLFEVPPGERWGVYYTTADLGLIRGEGFDHVRIPVGWHHYTGPGPEFRIRPEIFARVDVFTNAALREGLGVIVDLHQFEPFTSNPAAETPRFLAIWRQVAQHYLEAQWGLAFELLNEPKEAATTEVVNPIFAEAIQQIRRIDPDRTIFVGPGSWNSIAELPRLRLPDNDSNLIVTVHNYEPMYFTRQGVNWSGPDFKLTGFVFPGPPSQPLIPDGKLKLNPWVIDWIKAYNTEPTAANPSSPKAFQGSIDQAREWSEYFGRPIHVGEFGCVKSADPASRAHYYRAFRDAAEKADIGWTMWSWKAIFPYWDFVARRPEPGMHEALFESALPAPKQR